MTLRPSTKTFQTLSQEVKRLFGDESGVQLEDADIRRWANEAQMEIVNVNGAIKATSVSNSVAGQDTYDFPDVNIQQIASIQYDNTLLPNTPFAEAQRLMSVRDLIKSPQGTPEVWYEWGGKFTLWPVPDASKRIQIFYTAYPAELTGDPNERLSVPDKFWPAVVNYIMSKAYEMDEEYQASQLAESRFQTALQMQADDERRAQDMAFPVIQEVDY